MAKEVSRAVRLCGTDRTDPPTRLLNAGALSVELDNGALRYVRMGEIEVLRGIAFLVRDENWGTYTPAIDDLAIDEGTDGFSVTYRATCSDAKQTIVYDARITARPDGSLDFEVVADPRTDVLTNRTGFVVLHPIDGIAGQPVKVLHVDGRQEDARFPDLIDPAQPFYDIRALSHEIAPGVWATCGMEGDAFEMEDQRNWSDASYKTYVRPLARPWPYTLPKGEKVTQAVRLRFEGRVPAAAAGSGSSHVALTFDAGAVGTLPDIGIGVPMGEASHALAASQLVKRMGPRWLACNLDLRHDGWREAIGSYRELGETVATEIALEIVTQSAMDPAGELAPVAEAVRAAGLAPAAIAVFPAQDLRSVLPGSPWPEVPSQEDIVRAARAAFPGVKLGGGMFSYFTELNRKRPLAGQLDYVTHTTCPIVHAADDRSVMETLECLPHIIRSTRGFIGDTAYRIGPSAIGCRDNPYGKSAPLNPDNGRVCLTQVDPRQRGLFNAAWTLAYVAAFARGGIEAVAVGAPTGPFGHIYRRQDHAQPYFDEVGPQAVYPSFHVLAGLAPNSGARLVGTSLSKAGTVAALAFAAEGGATLWLANLTAAPATVDLAATTLDGARLVILDAGSFDAASTNPDFLGAAGQSLDGQSIALDAYAVASISGIAIGQ
jgi:D-apionolactonase